MNHAHSYRISDGARHANAEVAAWLEKSCGDMVMAEIMHASGASGTSDGVCYHAQQAVEKLAKAALASAGIEPPRVHDLVKLCDLLREVHPRWTWNVQQLSDLSAAAVEVRYPGFSARPEDAKAMLAIAVEVWGSLRPLL